MTHISRINPELPKLFLEQGQIRIVDFKGSDYKKSIAEKTKYGIQASKIARISLYLTFVFLAISVPQLFLQWLSGGKIFLLFAMTFLSGIATALIFISSEESKIEMKNLEDELNIIMHEFQPELLELEKKAAQHRAQIEQYEHKKKFDFQRVETL